MSNTNEHTNHQEVPEIDELTKDRYLGGHEYDGIRELDNRLPRWWLYLFIITIVFSVVYLLGYHVTKWWPLQEAEYDNAMALVADTKKAEPQPVVDLENMVPMTASTDLAAGQETFKKICSVCHGQKGEGLVGPNFTDMNWIHGDSIAGTVKMKDLYQVVTNGVIEKGMIPYKDQLSPTQIQQVLSFILTLQGTNPPNAKAPQGPKYAKFG
jgi:cytochrome c oxidase cbb3-type subunit 3